MLLSYVVDCLYRMCDLLRLRSECEGEYCMCSLLCRLEMAWCCYRCLPEMMWLSLMEQKNEEKELQTINLFLHSPNTCKVSFGSINVLHDQALTKATAYRPYSIRLTSDLSLAV